jgi:tRNA A-37 threonylcarbamoyl transferase component Bud32
MPFNSFQSPLSARTKLTRLGRVEVHPRWRGFLVEQGLAFAEDFLQFRGEIVSGHVRRHVLEMELNGFSGFLKKEHSVRWSDRLSNWWHGFGAVSKSIREGQLLQRLNALELPAPEWIAQAEWNGQAFLLIARVPEAVDLRIALGQMPRSAQSILAREIGEHLAKVHAAGFDHPDLYAKHVLVDRASWSITFIDWQRSRSYRQIPIRERARSLATLWATLPESTLFEKVLSGYLAVTGKAVSRGQLEAEIDSIYRVIQDRLNIRRQRDLSGTEPVQKLVWLDGEAVCVRPELVEEFESSDWIDWVHRAINNGKTRTLRDGRTVRLQVSGYRWSMRRIASQLSGKIWRAEEMKLARRLFHAERLGQPGPKVIAFGQRERSQFDATAFVLCEETP